MNRQTIAWTLAGMFLVAVPFTATARGRNQGVNCPATGSQVQSGTQTQVRQRLRDGSCGNPDCPNQGSGGMRRGCGRGPGDGTGNQGVRPQDGTGYGAPGGN